MSELNVYEVLNRKRRGAPLDTREIEQFIERYTRGEIPDYQMSALLMAIAINGMTAEEMATLTQSMLRSGDQWHLRSEYDFIADKHSTGGVGDKVSLVLSPWVAACGIPIGMLSGRGLGHTGGTLDKLEAIPGFNARLSREEFDQSIADSGCVISTSTEGIAPADKKIYALRDVTGTVESLPLITASIMSKKLAMGASALILDVKTGSGAFMRHYQDSKALAQSLIAAAAGSGTRVEALITDMDRPLGVAAGNANEIIETIEVLKGNGPADVEEVTRAQAVRTLVMSGKFDDASAAAALDDALDSGRALEQARKWIAAQGGDPAIVDDYSLLPEPRTTIEVKAPQSGFITFIDTYQAGMFTVDLGAGRKKADDVIDYAAGVMFDRKTGDEVRAGDTIARIQLGSGHRDADELTKRYLAFVTFGDEKPEERPLIHEHLV
ncbi:MAG: thymidine phosphorylase [Acidobacteria bacterium]|nr:thymidine phosphorylase [Acidobacteriota bacterium]MBV9067120.1 thymidine phosphorylase [Acidobacteriota bacterium]MBV9184008.1 thymidine phosphorylase [Acidobacteriota bacterium]